jgi:hypothetical protein
MIIEMRCPGMYFNIPGPLGITNTDAGIKKVRTGITVIFTRIQDADRIAFVVLKTMGIIKTVFPQIMEKFFLHRQHDLKAAKE